MNIKNAIFRMLPTGLQELRHQMIKGQMDQGCQQEQFIYDSNMINKLGCESYSQYGQDIFILNMTSIGNLQGEGVFLDIGGNLPIELNNTYLFEKRGWKGYAFEPIRSLADKWKEVRSTPCINIAIGNEDGEVEFTECEAHVLSGIGLQNENETGVTHTYKVKQQKLSTFLNTQRIDHIDVVFIDVEGYEMNVLEGIDFDSVSITCLCIENNRDSDLKFNKKLRDFLFSKGYRLVARLTIDDVFIKNTFFEKN